MTLGHPSQGISGLARMARKYLGVRIGISGLERKTYMLLLRLSAWTLSESTVRRRQAGGRRQEKEAEQEVWPGEGGRRQEAGQTIVRKAKQWPGKAQLLGWNSQGNCVVRMLFSQRFFTFCILKLNYLKITFFLSSQPFCG